MRGQAGDTVLWMFAKSVLHHQRSPDSDLDDSPVKTAPNLVSTPWFPLVRPSTSRSPNIAFLPFVVGRVPLLKWTKLSQHRVSLFFSNLQALDVIFFAGLGRILQGWHRNHGPQRRGHAAQEPKLRRGGRGSLNLSSVSDFSDLGGWRPFWWYICLKKRRRTKSSDCILQRQMSRRRLRAVFGAECACTVGG